MQTIWLSPTNFVSGDPTLRISYPYVSHPGAVVTCTEPGDLKWVSMGLRLPPDRQIGEVVICYQVSNAGSFISQVRLAEMTTPDHATVIHDDATHLASTAPTSYASVVPGLVPSGAVTLELRLNFQNTSDEIMLGAVGVKMHVGCDQATAQGESWWTDVETFVCSFESLGSVNALVDPQDTLAVAVGPFDALAESKATFITHCPIGADFIDRCHKFDKRCFPYATFYYGGDSVLYISPPIPSDSYQGVEFGKHKFYLIQKCGKPQPSPFQDIVGVPRLTDGVGLQLGNPFVTCPNVLEYQDKMVEWVEYLMKNGADGIFLDTLYNSQGLPQQACWGARLGIHPHIFPDPADPTDPSAQKQAFASLLHRAHHVIKKHRPDGRILGNSGSPLKVPVEFQQYLASDMLEDYVCGIPTAPTPQDPKIPNNPSGRTPEWQPGITWDAVGRQLQTYLAGNKEILVLSRLFGNNSPRNDSPLGISQYGVDEDAFLCYATARLAGFIWAFTRWGDFPADQELNVRKLFSLRLGKPLSGELTDPTSGILYRVFERGLVAVNGDTDTNDPEHKTLAPPHIVSDNFVDVFSGKWTNVLNVPKYSGRVFLLASSDPRLITTWTK